MHTHTHTKMSLIPPTQCVAFQPALLAVGFMQCNLRSCPQTHGSRNTQCVPICTIGSWFYAIVSFHTHTLLALQPFVCHQFTFSQFMRIKLRITTDIPKG